MQHQEKSSCTPPSPLPIVYLKPVLLQSCTSNQRIFLPFLLQGNHGYDVLNVHAHARGKPQQKKNKAQQLQRLHKPIGYGPSVIRYACCREFCVHLVFSFVTVFSAPLQSASTFHTKHDPRIWEMTANTHLFPCFYERTLRSLNGVLLSFYLRFFLPCCSSFELLCGLSDFWRKYLVRVPVTHFLAPPRQYWPRWSTRWAI